MPPRHVVVDGSNLATEGRSLPSLAQLDEAVRAYKQEWPDDDVLVVVDASFSYRIDESERRMFEEAENAGEVVSPPAGAIGRGDGFLLRIADRTDAVVLSNDSFQEFHGEYPWLFDEGRLVGGKPVPGVGWIFTPRSPVRGPKSRVSVRDAKTRRRADRAEPVAQAIAEATAEAVSPDPKPQSSRRGSRRRGRSREAEPEAVNEPLPFITFIAEHRLGTEVEGTVDSFTSHGAFVVADGARCYAPVVGLGDPPPRSAKDVLKRGETRMFIVQALDAPRRGIELALPGLAKVAGAPTDETVEAEIDVTAQPSRRRRGARPTPSEPAVAAEPVAAEPEPAAVAELAAVAEPVAAETEVAAVAELPAVAEPEPEPAVGSEPEPAVAGPRRNAARRSRAAVAVPPEPEAPVVVPVKRARKAATPKAAADADPVATADPAAPAAPKKAAKKVAVKKAAAPTAPEKAAKKVTARKRAAPETNATAEPAAPAAPEKAVKKAAVKKAAVKKAAPPEKAAPKKAASRRAPLAQADEAAARTSAKKAVAKKSAAKKAAAKKAPAKKAAAAPTG